MTAPIKTCDYCGVTGEMPTFMNGETICYTCMHVLPKTLPEARQELMRLQALLAVVAQPAPSVPEGVSFIDTSQPEGVMSTEIVHSYPPPSGWLRAIDEALVVAHLGVANASDTYEQAKAKLDSLVGFHVDVATDPAVNGGWKLVPRPPTPTMVKAGLESSHVLNVHRVLACYDAMIDAAPEAKR